MLPVAKVARWRLTSCVFDPAVAGQSTSNPPTGTVTQAEYYFGLSGNTFRHSDMLRPMRMRFGKEYAGEGMWHYTNGASTIPSSDPISSAILPFVTISPNQPGMVVSTEVLCRVAWSDLGEGA